MWMCRFVDVLNNRLVEVVEVCGLMHMSFTKAMESIVGLSVSLELQEGAIFGASLLYEIPLRQWPT